MASCGGCGGERNAYGECRYCDDRDRRRLSRAQKVAFWLTAHVFHDDNPAAHVEHADALIHALGLPYYPNENP